MKALPEETRAKITSLREQGFGYHTIGKRAGVSATTVRRITKPGYAEHMRHLSREAKRRRVGVCDICGGETRYSGKTGGDGTSKTCSSCAHEAQHESRYWKREQVIAAIQEYARRNGQPPVSTDWLYALASERTEPDGFLYPHVAVVIRECGSWANAIEEAGFERPRPGWNPRGKKGRAPWVTEEHAKQRIVAYYQKHGTAPSAADLRGAYEILRKRGINWRQTLLELGITPRYRGGRRRREQ